jgi:hypothetical protein
MATVAQIEANRQNAQLSTGPRTEEGKAGVARNARTHGLFSATFSVAPTEREEFSHFLAVHRHQLQPEGIIEETTFTLLVQAAWKLEIIRRIEAADLEKAPLDDEETEKKLDRLSRYATRLERSYYRALNELRKLQTQRSLLAAGSSVEPPPPLAAPAGAKKQTQSQTPAADLDPFFRQLHIETQWLNARLRAVRQGLELPAARPEPSTDGEVILQAA